MFFFFHPHKHTHILIFDAWAENLFRALHHALFISFDFAPVSMQHGLIHKTVTNKHTRSYSLYAIFVPRDSHTPTQTIGTHFRLYFSLASIFSVNVCHRLLIHPGASFHFIIVFALLQNSQTIFSFSLLLLLLFLLAAAVYLLHMHSARFLVWFSKLFQCVRTRKLQTM